MPTNPPQPPTAWVLREELRPQVPVWFFWLLCEVSRPIGRRWMLMQPFRRLLFRKVRDDE